MDWKALGIKAWDKLSLGALKCFRGLVCEKKDNGWELSKGRTAFWIVLTHCMYVWNGGAKAAKAVVDTAVDAAAVGGDAAADVATAGVKALSTMASVQTSVPDQEFYLLMALLGYSAIKTTKGGLTNLIGAARAK